ncbi:MAG: hypothetical protein A2W03_02820 [Candidatus Aminicenantes bacterium RBG_16_63_16]|nr:MAG: hypothetical protein A2W03_02820 [Candidatus Aminicenantes bacterium RBG_16_63_16]
MRVLHCLHNYHPARGGAEWLMKNVSERLAAKGHDITVIASNALSVEDYVLPGGGKRLLPAGQDNVNGVRVLRVPFSRRGVRVLNALRGVANRFGLPLGDRLRMLSWGPRSRRYYREALAVEADLIAACPLPTMNVGYARRAAAKKKIPLVIIPCFHTEDRFTFHNRLYFRWLREADAVITLTDWERDYLHRVAGVALENLHPIGVGIDIDEPDSAAGGPDARPAPGPETVMFIGQHGLHKGILHLLRAMEHVWTEREGARLVIAGNPTAHTPEIERKIRDLPPPQRARVELIKGFPEDEKRSLLGRADVFVSVSSMESFGIVFLEAWREKLAVIGCRRGGSSKIIDEFRDGLLVEFGRPRELAGAILELLENKDIRAGMGQAGHRKTLERYSWAKVLPLWETLYEDIVRRKRSPVPAS